MVITDDTPGKYNRRQILFLRACPRQSSEGGNSAFLVLKLSFLLHGPFLVAHSPDILSP